MKKFLVVIVISFSTSFLSYGQNKHPNLDSARDANLKKMRARDTIPACLFFYFDSQMDFKERNEKLQKQEPFASNYFWLSYNRGPMGITSNIWRGGDGTLGFSLGPMYNTMLAKRTYFECSIGWWIEVSDKFVTHAGTSYLYFETKAGDDDQRLENGKIISMVTGMYYPSEREWWYQGYAVIMPIKSIGLGFFAEADGSFGPRVQCNVGFGKSGLLSAWTAGGFNKALSVGANVSFEFEWKKKRKK